MGVYGWGQTLRVSLALVLAACMITSGVLAVRQGPDLGICGLLASLALFCAVLPMFLQRRYDICEPATVIALSVMVGAALRTLFLLASDSEEAHAFLLLNQPVEILLKASLYVAIGLAAYAAGYLYVTRAGAIRPLQFVCVHWQWNEGRFLLLVGLFIAISLVSIWMFYRQFAALVLIESLGDFSSKRFADVEGGVHRTAYGYLRWGASLSGTAILFLTVSLARRTDRNVLLKCIMLAGAAAAALGFAFFTSKRLELVLLFGGAGMAFLYVRGRVATGVVAAIIILMLCLFVFMTALRSKAASLEDAARAVTATEVLATLVVDRHFIDISKTAMIQQEFRQTDDFLYGTSYLTLFAAPIPRVWWPEKPSIQLGHLVGERVYGLRFGGSGVPPGMLGELWINFGWVMLLPGMFLMGSVLRLVYQLFDGIRSLPNGAVLYIGAMIPLAWSLSNRNITACIIDLVTSLIPIVIGIWFISHSVRCAVFSIGGSGDLQRVGGSSCNPERS